MISKKEFNLSEERTKLFNSMPYIDVDGWDRTKIADEIRKQDAEFIKRLKKEFFIMGLPNRIVEKRIDKLAGSKFEGVK